MSKKTMAAVALSFFALSGAGSAQQPAPPPAEALDGVDVVVLLKQGKEVFGKSALSSVHAGFTYLFSSAESKAEFERAPDKYAIQLGGLCARMGGTVTGNPSDYTVHDGKIYIFGSDECRKLFIASPAKYLPRPSAPMPASGDAVTKGRALLDKAAAAHGGPKLDAMTSYVESWTTTQQRQTGPVSIANKNLWRFPGGARNERTIPLASGTMSIATVVAPAGVWGVGNGGRVMTPPAAAVPAVQRAVWQQLLPLLRMRRESGVKVAALGPASIEGARLERVRVVHGGVDIVLNVDPLSGRVHSAAYVDRKNDGEVGQIAIAYGDFRPVEGVLVPFAEKATFNGTPDATLTRTLDSVAVNSALDAALFTRPAGAGK